MSSPAATARLLLLPTSPSLGPRSLRLLRGAAARRSSRRLGVVRAASAEVAATDAAAPGYTSDSLILYFKAEGTMEERAIPKITQALEGVEGVSDLEVLIEEGIGSVVLTKETTVQATGVASNLVEAIQGAGFKLQTLSLSFDDFNEDAATVAGEDDDQATE
uniref:HMA domain-containing protein n=1 Tax=Oryza punctata TaxID=4537 RepID=A0A0E0L163_ORYPU